MEEDVFIKKTTKDKAALKHMKETIKLAREVSPMIRDKFLWEYLKQCKIRH